MATLKARWAITGSWEPLVLFQNYKKNFNSIFFMKMDLHLWFLCYSGNMKANFFYWKLTNIFRNNVCSSNYFIFSYSPTSPRCLGPCKYPIDLETSLKTFISSTLITGVWWNSSETNKCTNIAYNQAYYDCTYWDLHLIEEI